MRARRYLDEEIMIGDKSKSGGTTAISTDILTALIVGLFVAAVIVALVFVYGASTLGTNTASQQQCGNTFAAGSICVTNVQLYSGNPSSRSLDANCTGDAQFVIHGQNLADIKYYISNLTIYGGSLKQRNATTLIAVGNSCLSIAEVNPQIAPTSFFSFYGFVDEPLQPYAEYSYLLVFSNGESLGGSLVAQV